MRGHVTGHVPRGPHRLQRDGGKHNSLSQSLDLAKLNPNFHMNYSIILTEISFYPETSNLFEQICKSYLSMRSNPKIGSRIGYKIFS